METDAEKGDAAIVADTTADKESSHSNDIIGSMTELVDWDGPYDPKNPMNWSLFRKWSTIILVSYITFVT